MAQMVRILGARNFAWTLLIIACCAFAVSAEAAETSLVLISDSGDYIGAGQTQVYTASDGNFGALSNGVGVVNLNFNTPTFSHFWGLSFAAPSGQVLAVGSYFGATRFPFEAAGEPGLDISGDGRGCDTLSGSFQVKQIVLGPPPGNTVVSFWAVFEQHCEGFPPALRGSILFNAGLQVAVTAPLETSVEKGASLSLEVSATDAGNRTLSLSASGTPPGASFTDNGDGTGVFAWNPGFNQAGTYDVVFRGENDLGDFDTSTTRITVTGVTSLLLDSEPGDTIGLGQRRFLTPEDGSFIAFRNFANGVSLSFRSDTGWWDLGFAAPFNADLRVGTYDGAVRWPFQNSDQAGLSISGEGRECSTLTGSFEVKQVVYGSSFVVDAFWATFEQHCDGGVAALRGEIRYKADVPLLVRSPSRVSGLETVNLSFPVTTLSASGAPIQLTATGLPQGAVFTDHGDSTGTFEWTPSKGQVGSYSIEFLGDDGNGLTDQSFSQIQISLRNDDFDNAVVVGSLPFSDQFDPSLATAALDDPVCYLEQYPSVWYRITPATDATLALSVSSNYSRALSVYTGTRGALNSIGCVEGSQLAFPVAAGQTYTIQITAPPFAGPVSLTLESLPLLPNDSIDDATPITSLPFDVEADTRTATPDPTDPSSCFGRGATLWYRLTVPTGMPIDASTVGSDYRTTLSVYTGSPGAFSQIQCDFNHVSFNALPGETYYFMVGSADDNPGGHLRFSVVSLPPFTLDLIIAPVGLVTNRTGEAYIHGSVDCSRSSQMHIFGTVRQRLGRALFGASFEIEKPCGGPTGWFALLRSDSGLFTAGTLEVEMSATAHDFRTGELLQAGAAAAVRLRGAKSLPASATAATEPVP